MDPFHKKVVALILLSLTITLAGMVITTVKVRELGIIYNLLTSAVTDTSATGEVNLTINSVTAMDNQNALINFGVGRINGTCLACQMDSNNSATAGLGTVVNLFSNGSNVSELDIPNHCCLNFTEVSSGFLLENTGNTNISVGYTCAGNCTHLTLIGGKRDTGTAISGNLAFSPLMIKVSPNNVDKQSGESGVTDTANACRAGGATYRDGSVNITNTTSYFNASDGGNAYPSARNVTQGFIGWGSDIYAPLSNRGHWLCGNYTNSPLMPDNEQDALVVDVNITIFDDAPATSLRSSLRLTFNGTSQ